MCPLSLCVAIADGVEWRLPADLQWWDRNRFVLSVDEESAVEEKNEDEDEDDDDDEDEDEEDESEDASTDTTTATTDAESFDLEEHFTKALEKAIDDMPMSELKPHLKVVLTHLPCSLWMWCLKGPDIVLLYEQEAL